MAGKRDDVRGRQFALDLGTQATAFLKSLCQEQHVSPFVLLLSLFGFVIGQRCHTQQFTLGVTLSGRSRCALRRTSAWPLPAAPPPARGIR